MGNLGQREKYGIGLVAVLIVAFVIYFAGIRNLQAKKVELEIQRADLQTQIDTLQALKDNNDVTQANIKAITEEIKEIEKTFIPVLNTESIEQYVLKTFEENGVVYLNTVSTATVPTDNIILPNGAAASESLQVLRVKVQFATSDGFNFGQYNKTPDYMDFANREMVTELIDGQYSGGEPMVPYNEKLPLDDYLAFIKAVKEIEKTGIPEGAAEGTPSTCVKVNSISMESDGGYMLLTAEIDFYSAILSDRLSTPDFGAPYITWNGTPVSQIGTKGEMGRRLLFIESESDWNYIMLVESDAIHKDRPFAAYWSNQLFDQIVSESGDLAGVLLGGLEEEVVPEMPEEN
ncbi:MAG: hypothetical protein MJ093_05660 [Saccharofermentans sp.]|nr:hypothetical protein [Saccharofermentans sp.]